jgi:hypothetical protein
MNNQLKRREKMKLGKKTYISGGIIVFLGAVLVSAGLISGCGPHMFCDGDFSEHVLSRMDSRVEKLELYDSQQQKYEEIRLKVKANLDKGKEERRKFISELQNEINKENPDINALMALVKAKFRAGPIHLTDNLDLFAEFYNILDDEQKGILLKRLRKKMNRFSMIMCED